MTVVAFPPASVGGAGAAGGELLLGVLGPEALAGDLDEVRAVGEAIEGRGGEQGLAEEVCALGAIAIGDEEGAAGPTSRSLIKDELGILMPAERGGACLSADSLVTDRDSIAACCPTP